MPELKHAVGTAYDMFISLLVLHEPGRFGLRGTWAAGVRSRVPAAERGVLQQLVKVAPLPLAWVHGLPEPRDGATVLTALRRLSPVERVAVLMISDEVPTAFKELFQTVSQKGRWTADEEKALEAVLKDARPPTERRPKAAEILPIWADAATTGERWLAALDLYHSVFFAEEEKRIEPALRAAAARARALENELSLPALLETLTEGLRFGETIEGSELVLVPSFWAPLLIMLTLDSDRQLFVYGSRPADASLVPGEVVPDALQGAMKALADPTRLRILRYLAQEPLSPSQLAHRLRLRAPTVIHHLDTLRLARLVYLTLRGKDKHLYAVRPEAIAATWKLLRTFLAIDDPMDEAE